MTNSMSGENLQGLISPGPRLTSYLFVVLSSPKFDASFLVFSAWPGVLVALLQMTVFRCTYVPQSRGELLHHQLVTRETMQASGLGAGGCGGYSDPSLSSRTASVGLLGRGVDPGGCKKEEGPPLLDTPPRQHSDTNIFNGNALHSA